MQSLGPAHTLGAEPEMRKSHAMTSLRGSSCGGTVVVHGGQNEGNFFLSDMHFYHVHRREWTSVAYREGRQPLRRTSHSLTAVAPTLLVLFGGSTAVAPGKVEDANDLWLFDVRNQVWSLINTKGDAPSKRAGHTAVFGVAGDNVPGLFVFGGAEDDDAVYRVSIHDWTWSRLRIARDADGCVPPVRASHAAVWVDSLKGMLICGGSRKTGDASTHLNDMWIFQNVSRNKWRWKRLPVNGFEGRIGHSAALLPSSKPRIIIWGGMSVRKDREAFLNDFTVVDLVSYGVSVYSAHSTSLHKFHGRMLHGWARVGDMFLIYGGIEARDGMARGGGVMQVRLEKSLLYTSEENVFDPPIEAEEDVPCLSNNEQAGSSSRVFQSNDGESIVGTVIDEKLFLGVLEPDELTDNKLTGSAQVAYCGSVPASSAVGSNVLFFDKAVRKEHVQLKTAKSSALERKSNLISSGTTSGALDGQRSTNTAGPTEKQIRHDSDGQVDPQRQSLEHSLFKSPNQTLRPTGAKSPGQLNNSPFGKSFPKQQSRAVQGKLSFGNSVKGSGGRELLSVVNVKGKGLNAEGVEGQSKNFNLGIIEDEKNEAVTDGAAHGGLNPKQNTGRAKKLSLGVEVMESAKSADKSLKRKSQGAQELKLGILDAEKIGVILDSAERADKEAARRKIQAMRGGASASHNVPTPGNAVPLSRQSVMENPAERHQIPPLEHIPIDPSVEKFIASFGSLPHGQGSSVLTRDSLKFSKDLGARVAKAKRKSVQLFKDNPSKALQGPLPGVQGISASAPEAPNSRRSASQFLGSQPSKKPRIADIEPTKSEPASEGHGETQRRSVANPTSVCSSANPKSEGFKTVQTPPSAAGASSKSVSSRVADLRPKPRGASRPEQAGSHPTPPAANSVVVDVDAMGVDSMNVGVVPVTVSTQAAERNRFIDSLPDCDDDSPTSEVRGTSAVDALPDSPDNNEVIELD